MQGGQAQQEDCLLRQYHQWWKSITQEQPRVRGSQAQKEPWKFIIIIIIIIIINSTLY